MTGDDASVKKETFEDRKLTFKQWSVLVLSGILAGSGGSVFLPVMAPELHPNQELLNELEEQRRALDGVKESLARIELFQTHAHAEGPKEVRAALNKMEAHMQRCGDQLIGIKTMVDLCGKHLSND